MTNQFNRGKRDAQHGIYRPPHDRGVFHQIVEPFSRKEIEGRRDYGDGLVAGKKIRDRK